MMNNAKKFFSLWMKFAVCVWVLLKSNQILHFRMSSVGQIMVRWVRFPIEVLEDDYGSKGFAIAAFPCNQFGYQVLCG